jgi:uncharacterized integral membrane protein
MIAANIWHWWIGVVLLFAALGAVLSVGAGYFSKVTAMKYPNRRQRRK